MDEIKPWKKHDYLWFAWHRLTSSPHAATTPNIQAGFCAAGIFPFNWDIFGEHEYLPSDVTDRPLDQVIPVPQQPRASAVQSSSSAVTDQAIPVPQQPSMPATSLSAVTEVTSLSVVTVPTCLDDALSTPTTFTPESVRPFPKAGPQIGRLNNCIKRKTTKILTVKWALELEQEKRKSQTKKSQKPKKNANKRPSKKTARASRNVHKATSSKMTYGRSVCCTLLSASNDIRIVCKAIGQSDELWCRCTSCGCLVHTDCSGADTAKDYVCNYCSDDYE